MSDYPFSVPDLFPPTPEGQETEPPSVRNDNADPLPYSGDNDDGITMPAPTDRELAEDGNVLHRPDWDPREESPG